MFTGGSSQLVADIDRLRADFDVLREANASLRSTCARNGLSATSSWRSAARTCLDSRRLRGEFLRVKLPRDLTSGALARRLLEERLDTLAPETMAAAKTVVSELVNNAVVHGHGAIELRVSRRRGRVRFDVRDEGKDATIRTRTAERPHGLDIVDALSLTWGAHEGSTHVWAELHESTPAPG